MLDQDVARRVKRLLRGERRVEDLDRIFLALRDDAHGRASIREIGDFVAHRDTREKGPVTQKVRDIFISFRSWLKISVARKPFTPGEIRVVAEANLRIVTDEQLETRLGLKRNIVKSVLEQALRKAERGKKGTERETKTVDYLGGAFIWNPAFTDTEVFEDLAYVLEQVGALDAAEVPRFTAVAPFLALYVVALMHGSAVLLEGGARAELVAGFANDQGRLEVKARLMLVDIGKPVFAPVCIFWTQLQGVEHCGETLLDAPVKWHSPIEIDAAGKLAPLE